MSFIQCLVIDEADRMVEKFHFEHLLFILSELNQKYVMSNEHLFAGNIS